MISQENPHYLAFCHQGLGASLETISETPLQCVFFYWEGSHAAALFSADTSSRGLQSQPGPLQSTGRRQSREISANFAPPAPESLRALSCGTAVPHYPAGLVVHGWLIAAPAGRYPQ